MMVVPCSTILFVIGCKVETFTLFSGSANAVSAGRTRPQDGDHKAGGVERVQGHPKAVQELPTRLLPYDQSYIQEARLDRNLRKKGHDLWQPKGIQKARQSHGRVKNKGTLSV